MFVTSQAPECYPPRQPDPSPSKPSKLSIRSTRVCRRLAKSDLYPRRPDHSFTLQKKCVVCDTGTSGLGVKMTLLARRNLARVREMEGEGRGWKICADHGFVTMTELPCGTGMP